MAFLFLCRHKKEKCVYFLIGHAYAFRERESQLILKFCIYLFPKNNVAFFSPAHHHMHQQKRCFFFVYVLYRWFLYCSGIIIAYTPPTNDVNVPLACRTWWLPWRHSFSPFILLAKKSEPNNMPYIYVLDTELNGLYTKKKLFPLFSFFLCLCSTLKLSQVGKQACYEEKKLWWSW